MALQRWRGGKNPVNAPCKLKVSGQFQGVRPKPARSGAPYETYFVRGAAKVARSRPFGTSCRVQSWTLARLDFGYFCPSGCVQPLAKCFGLGSSRLLCIGKVLCGDIGMLIRLLEWCIWHGLSRLDCRMNTLSQWKIWTLLNEAVIYYWWYLLLLETSIVALENTTWPIFSTIKCI